jgi:hypothetical protein
MDFPARLCPVTEFPLFQEVRRIVGFLLVHWRSDICYRTNPSDLGARDSDYIADLCHYQPLALSSTIRKFRADALFATLRTAAQIGPDNVPQ